MDSLVNSTEMENEIASDRKNVAILDTKEISKTEENIELHMDHFINNLLPHVRFPMMTPAQLADLLLNPLSQTHTELLVERIRIAMCYHKNQLELSQGGQVRSSPRLCTFTTI